MEVKELYNLIVEKAIEFGLKSQNDPYSTRNLQNENGNAVTRDATDDGSFASKGAYFGFIREGQRLKEGYSDLSWIIFPQKNGNRFVMSLQIGTSDAIVKDRELLSRPGTRRNFLKLRGTNKNDETKSLLNPRFKYSFLDFESPQIEIAEDIKKYPELADNGILKYLDTSIASVIIDASNPAEMEVCYGWLAQYAFYRRWPNNADQMNSIDDAISAVTFEAKEDHVKNVFKELKRRHCVIMYGAPGVGKTYTADKISEYEGFFTKSRLIQFHAETSYSDFVGGLAPDTEYKEGLRFEPKKGILQEMIDDAVKDPGHNYLLVIDEINRANLSNVLGPIFYLFENEATGRNLKLDKKQIDAEISSLPANLFVLGTMNSSDRSIAMVDYALRRRFSWYLLRPQAIEADSEHEFHREAFRKMERIFTDYASDNEMALQPGPSYFLTPKEDAEDIFRSILEYELKPLIKEYFEEGYLTEARSVFGNFFLDYGVMLYD